MEGENNNAVGQPGQPGSPSTQGQAKPEPRTGPKELVPELEPVRKVFDGIVANKGRIIRTIAISVAAFLIIAGGLLYLSRHTDDILPAIIGEKPTTTAVLKPNDIEGRDFSDPETGVSFKYPERWGEPRVETRYIFAQSYKEVSFSAEQRARIFMSMQHPSSVGWLQDQGVYTGADHDSFCNLYPLYKRTSKDEEFGGGTNTFRPSGFYAYQECSMVPPFVNVATKTLGAGADPNWIDIESPRSYKSTTQLYRDYFFRTGSPIYSSLTVRGDAGATVGSDYCTKKVQLTLYSGDFRFSKNYLCINYSEKDMIERRFRGFDDTDFSVELKVPALTMKTEIVSSPGQSEYEQKFNETRTFAGELTFDYPTLLSAPVRSGSEISFPSDPDRSFRVAISTKADAEAGDAQAKKCSAEKCLLAWLDSALYAKEMELVSNGRPGPVACPVSDKSLAGTYGRKCEIADLRGGRALVRYFAGFTTEGNIEKNYVFYSPGGKRYDVFVRSATAVSDKLNDFIASENTDLTLKVAERIAESAKAN